MKNFLTIGLATIAFIVALASVGPILALLCSIGFAIAGLYVYNRTTNKILRILLVIAVAISALSAIANVPALLGVLALYIVYYGYNTLKNKSTPSINHLFQTIKGQLR